LLRAVADTSYIHGFSAFNLDSESSYPEEMPVFWDLAQYSNAENPPRRWNLKYHLDIPIFCNFTHFVKEKTVILA
jgi:hypothetical protein